MRRTTVEKRTCVRTNRAARAVEAEAAALVPTRPVGSGWAWGASASHGGTRERPRWEGSCHREGASATRLEVRTVVSGLRRASATAREGVSATRAPPLPLSAPHFSRYFLRAERMLWALLHLRNTDLDEPLLCQSCRFSRSVPPVFHKDAEG